jgi:hypothetical protein
LKRRKPEFSVTTPSKRRWTATQSTEVCKLWVVGIARKSLSTTPPQKGGGFVCGRQSHAENQKIPSAKLPQGLTCSKKLIVFAS